MRIAPEERFKELDTLLIALIPGPLAPIDLNSFLLPIVEEITTEAVDIFDARTGSFLRLRTRIAGVCADQPASAKVSKMIGPTGHTGCRMCVTKAAHRADSQSACYFPLSTPGTMGDAVNNHRPSKYDPYNLPMRTHNEYLENDHAFNRSKSSIRAEVKRNTGISGQSVFHHLDTFRVPFFSPVKIFYVTRLNGPQLIIRALRDKDIDNLCVSPASVCNAFGASIELNKGGLPAAFSPSAPRTPAEVGLS